MDKNKLETRSALAPTTRREMLAYAQILAFVLLVVGVAVTLLQFFFLQPEWIDLGSTGDVNRSKQPLPWKSREKSLRSKLFCVTWMHTNFSISMVCPTSSDNHRAVGMQTKLVVTPLE